jgi:signal transduction histidine kinase
MKQGTEPKQSIEKQSSPPQSPDYEALLREIELKDRFLAVNLLEMERTKGKFRQVLASMSGAVLMIELDGYLSAANPLACSLLGLKNDFPVQASRVLPPALCRVLDEVVDEGKHIHHDEFSLKDSEGHDGTYRLECRLVTDDSGHPVGILQVLEDRSEMVRMSQRLERTNTLAALGEMAASVAHELRNPLGGIGGFAALLGERLEEGSDERRYLNRIIEGVNGLNKVATNLLAYTRPVSPRFQSLDIRQQLREVLAYVQIEIEHDQSEISMKIELGELPVWVTQDPELLRQCFLNLFKNAVQSFEGKAGTIHCNVNTIYDELKKESFVEVHIRDDGPGIPADIRGKIFNPFFTTRAKGTGLGLAIVRKNIELQGGSIELESTLGEGTCFKVKLPLQKEST